MEETARPDPRADGQQNTARETAKKLCADIQAYLKTHPPKNGDPVHYPNDGYGDWIMRFLNAELTSHGQTAKLKWVDDRCFFVIHQLTPRTYDDTVAGIPLWVVIGLIVLLSWILEAAFIPVVN